MKKLRYTSIAVATLAAATLASANNKVSADATNNTVITESASQTVQDAVSDAQNAVNSAQSNVNSKEQALSDAQEKA